MIRKLQLVLLFTIMICLSSYGQDYSQEYGIMGMDEFKLEEYAPDKDAEAVVLFDVGTSRFLERNGSFEVVFERKTRVKILSEAGLKWAEIQIPYYQQGDIYETVHDIEAFTYNFENGPVKIPLNTSNIFNEKINDAWNAKKFALPNVKVGSIIEYKYTIKSQDVFNLRDWDFQWRIPVVHSEYEVSMVPFYVYVYIMQGANKFDSYKSYTDEGLPRRLGKVTYQDYIHKYIMRDLPAFKSEEFITSINDYIIKLDFQLSQINYPTGKTVEIMTTWDKMNKELLKNSDFGGYIKKSEKLAKKLINIDSLASKTDKEKFDAVLEYVKRNYNWNKYNGKFASKSPNDFIKDKYGSCADINLFTIGLLNAVGIDAKPVIISTRENGKIKYDYPLSAYFNYVTILANVEGEKTMSDATEILNLNNRIPSRCINDKGLIVDNEGVEWVSLECKFLSEVNNDIQIEIINNDVMNTTVSKAATEYDGLNFRNNYGDNTEAVKKRLENKDYAIIDSTINIQNLYDKEKPFILSYKQSSKPEIINEKIYIAPFLDEIISDNPLKQNERTYPIDMTYPTKRVFATTIIIPEGYQVDHTPIEQKVKNKLFELNYNTIQEDGKIKVLFDYTFNNSVYSPNDYTKIKSYFNIIVKKGNEKIVFAKIGE
ncbi:MAG: DUF3857 domain-containing protein [Dysgonamonadaceae bacterium]|nr:DUF3857 domain-containing protein [Dysgonamonadaceae bacterium]